MSRPTIGQIIESWRLAEDMDPDELNEVQATFADLRAQLAAKDKQLTAAQEAVRKLVDLTNMEVKDNISGKEWLSARAEALKAAEEVLKGE